MQRFPLIFFVLFVLNSCASFEVHTNYDFNKGTKKYSTFNFTARSSELVINEDNKNLLINLISAELEDRGYIVSDNPDFWVDIDAEIKRKIHPVTNQGKGRKYF